MIGTVWSSHLIGKHLFSIRMCLSCSPGQSMEAFNANDQDLTVAADIPLTTQNFSLLIHISLTD